MEDKLGENARIDDIETTEGNSPDTSNMSAEEDIGRESDKEMKSGKNDGKNSLYRSVVEFVEMLVLAVVIVMLVMTCVGRHSPVDGESMRETLQDKDLLILTNVFYTPKQGDIIVFETNENDTETGIPGTGYKTPYVKRVIATAGQVVDIEEVYDGEENEFGLNTKLNVYVDGELLQEDYATYLGFLSNPDYLEFPYTVPEGKVFVMGDNRNNSKDSRMMGSIDERCVIGKVLMRLYPFSSIKFF